MRLLGQMIDADWVTGGDGRHHLDEGTDRLSAPGNGTQYRLTAHGARALAAWDIPGPVLATDRPLRYCVDWTEQRHHLAGPLGTAVTARLFQLEWITRGPVHRSVKLTAPGEAGLARLLATESKVPR